MCAREKERKITIGFSVKQQTAHKETGRNEEKTVRIKTQQGCCGGRFKRISYLMFSLKKKLRF